MKRCQNLNARVLRWIPVAVICAALSICMRPAFADAAAASDAGVRLVAAAEPDSSSSQAETKKNGWSKTAAGKVYYVDGKRVTGVSKIGKAYYYFNAKGILRTSDTSVSGTKLYISKNGKIFGAKYKGAFYYGNLKPMTSVDAYEFETYLMARTLLASLCDKGDSKSVKRRKAFDWVVAQKYTSEYWHKVGASRKTWLAYYARLEFKGKGGNCYGASAAYAYLLAANGDSPTFFIDRRPAGTSHTWVEVGGKRYDPVYAKWQGYKNYYAAEGRGNVTRDGSWFEYIPVEEHLIPEFSSSHAEKGAKAPAALLDLGKESLSKEGAAITYYENGEKVKSAWRTIASKRYYFKKDGTAAVGSAEIDGVYYVFNVKGVLQTSSKSDMRTVKVSGETYRVDKDGKAVRGWSSGRECYYLKSGKMVRNSWRTIGKKSYYFKADGSKATGPTKIGKAYYLFDETGVLLKGASSKGSLVTVGANTYRIDETGKAVPGWSANRKKRFGASGLLLKGTRLISGKFYAADSKGNYLAERTAQLNAASEQGARATALRRLLGVPISELYSASCGFAGDDGVWEYKRFYVFTARPASVAKRFATIDDAIAAEDASETGTVKGAYEIIASIVAK